MPTSTIAVTGANGFVGGATARALALRGVAVRRLVKNPQASDEAAFDFLRQDTHAPALDGCDALFLLRPPPLGDVERHIFPLVDTAVARGVRRIVFLSVQGAESRAYLPHAKVEAHLATLPSSVAIGLMRPGFFAQNLVSAYRDDIRNDDRLYVCAAQGQVAFVDTEDLGIVAAQALAEGTLDGRAVALTGDVAHTFDDVARALSEVSAREIRYVPASLPGFFVHRMTRRGASFMEALVLTALHAGLRRGDGARIDHALGELLGRAPTSLRTVIERERSAFVSAHA
jgi:uncharacterized protein YbjT (DUF2867 family)